MTCFMTDVYMQLRAQHESGARKQYTLRTLLGKAHEIKRKEWEANHGSGACAGITACCKSAQQF